MRMKTVATIFLLYLLWNYLAHGHDLVKCVTWLLAGAMIFAIYNVWEM